MNYQNFVGLCSKHVLLPFKRNLIVILALFRVAVYITINRLGLKSVYSTGTVKKNDY